jgi:hypothetical protein
MNVCYYDQSMQEAKTVKFLSLQIEKYLNWKSHTDHIIPVLGATCFTETTLLLLASRELLKTVCFTYFPSVLSYRTIWGN